MNLVCLVAVTTLMGISAVATGERSDGEARRDIQYGEHARQVYDLLPPPRATDARPYPVVIYFHGGGFRKGDKSQLSERFTATMHAAGIGVVAANYRFFTTDPLPAAMHDGARVVQHLRRFAADSGIDPDRIALTGSSAGAGIAMWVACHDDLADADADDPVARESSRVTAAWLKDVQMSYDPAFWRERGLHRIADGRAFEELVGFTAHEPVEGEVLDAIRDASPITHLTAGDPPLRADFKATLDTGPGASMSALLHHPSHGVALREACEALGVACEVFYPGADEAEETGAAFLVRHLTADAGP